MRYLQQLPLTLALIHFLSQYTLPTLANTEIINFAAGNPVPVALLPDNWTILHAGANEIIVRDRTPAPIRGEGPPRDSLCDDDEDEQKDVDPLVRRNHCPHELWLALHLDGDLDPVRDGDSDEKRDDGHDEARKWKWWKWTWTRKGHHYDRFTLRVSWPASYPVQVELSLHRPQPALPSASPASSVRTARLRFARIRLVQEGIRVPRNANDRGAHIRDSTDEKEEEMEVAVPLVVLLEPLILGVLPASVLPVAATLLVLLSVLGIFGATTGVWAWVWRVVFGEVVERALKELAVVEVEDSKDRKQR